jgi:transposase InsO family protein
VHFNVTEHPTAQWIAHQVSEAFPWEAAPRYLIRDRDGVCGPSFQARVAGMGIEEVLTAPRTPWQNLFVERVIGSVRREYLDNVIVSTNSTYDGSLATTSSITTAVTARSPWTARRLGLCKGPSTGFVSLRLCERETRGG